MACKLHTGDMRNGMRLHNERHTSTYDSHTSDTHK